MHIPSSCTQDIDILTFDQALNSIPDKDYDEKKWIYVPASYSEYRYILGTRGENPLICIGINPSTAEPDNLDNTLKSVERIAAYNGYDSFIMFNVYPQRATNPDDMDREMNCLLHDENLKAFRYILSLYSSGRHPAIWASWGNLIEKRPYLVDMVMDMIDVGKQYGAVWYSCGKISKRGHPHHPLYLKRDAVPEVFDIESYCCMVKNLCKKSIARKKKSEDRTGLEITI